MQRKSWQWPWCSIINKVNKTNHQSINVNRSVCFRSNEIHKNGYLSNVRETFDSKSIHFNNVHRDEGSIKLKTNVHQHPRDVSFKFINVCISIERRLSQLIYIISVREESIHSFHLLIHQRPRRTFQFSHSINVYDDVQWPIQSS